MGGWIICDPQQSLPAAIKPSAIAGPLLRRKPLKTLKCCGVAGGGGACPIPLKEEGILISNDYFRSRLHNLLVQPESCRSSGC